MQIPGHIDPVPVPRAATPRDDGRTDLIGLPKAEIRAASPVPLQDRLAELQAFQGWMDQAHSVRNNPFVTRAQVL